MSSSLNLSGVFADAITEHLTIIRQFAAQEDAFERAAVRITDCLLAGNKLLLVRQRRQCSRLAASGG